MEGPFKGLSTDAGTHKVFIEYEGLTKRHNLEHGVIGASNPQAETPSVEDVIDQMVGHTQGTAKDRHYQLRLLGFTPEKDTFDDAKGLPWTLVIRYCRRLKIPIPDIDKVHSEADFAWRIVRMWGKRTQRRDGLP